MANSTAIMVLDYLSPSAVMAYYLSAALLSFCTLQSAKPSPDIPKKQKWAVMTMLFIIITYLAQAGVYIVAYCTHHWFCGQHGVVHLVLSILVWTLLDLFLLSSTSPVWHPYAGCWVLDFFFQVAQLSTAIQRHGIPPAFRWILLALNVTRILCFAGLLAISWILLTKKECEESSNGERQSLLGNGSNEESTGGNGSATNYGGTTASTDDEDEPVDRDKEIKEQQQKRLVEQGGWVGYLKGFAIFLPYLWPKNDFHAQLCLVYLGLEVVAQRVLNVLTPRQIGIITDEITKGTRGIPWNDILLWVFFYWVRGEAGLGLISNYADLIYENFAYRNINNLSFNHVLALSMDFHSNKDSGEIIRSIDQAQSLTSLIKMAMFEVSPIVLDLCISLWYVTHLFDIYLALSTLTVGIAFFAMGVTTTQYLRPYRRKYVHLCRKQHKTVFETVSNWQTVSYFNRKDFEEDRYAGAIHKTIRSEMAYYIRSSLTWAMQAIIMQSGFTFAVVLAAWEVTSGRKPVGNFVTLLLYWNTMMSPLYQLSYSYRAISQNLIDAERLLQLLQTTPAVQDPTLAKDLQLTAGCVEFSNVNFCYDERKMVLKNISFVAEPGKTIAFVGETGGGKSTMLKLLFRFYDVKDGSITIDGQDVRGVTLASLRDALGVVPQDPSLFNQSIIENIRYARLDATDEEIHDACRAAAVHDKIMSFPEGYKAKVGERGVKLSGGELQRVAIARVLIKNPQIVLLDEATSAVDSSTEGRIQDAFKKLSKGRTTFVIAHRLSTIMEADTILVVDQGEIVERGTHESLLRRDGKYRELWINQTTVKKSKKAEDEEQDNEEGTDGDEQKTKKGTGFVNDVGEEELARSLQLVNGAREEKNRDDNQPGVKEEENLIDVDADTPRNSRSESSTPGEPNNDG